MKIIITCITALLLINSCSTGKKDLLFNGKDLNGWYTFLSVPDSSIKSELPRDSGMHYINPLGLNNDVFKVFSVVQEDGEPAIRISGEVFGILVTENEYENYHLTLEFKWGEEKFAPRADKKRDSGVLYHSVGKEGAWGGVWMKSKECQVQESDLGDFIVVDTGTTVIPCIFDSTRNQYEYNAQGIPTEFNASFSYCHKSADFEKKNGEWNTLEIYTYGDNSVHVVNGNVNMRTYHSKISSGAEMIPNSKGKIQIQSEGAEVFYRNIRLENISEIPAGIWMELPEKL